MKKFKEGEIELFAPDAKIPTKRMDVFYNPDKTFCRDISVALVKALQHKWKKKMVVADALAGTGVRGIRMAKEAGSEVFINDKNTNACSLMKRNVKLNKVKVGVSCEDANIFLGSRKFDYIDIDPFGTPNPFLDAGIQALCPKKSVLAVCATDTAALSGTYPKVTKRKYGSDVVRTNFHDETGLRILIKHIILHGAQLDIGLVPVFSHSTRHYFRCYFERVNGSGRIDKLLDQIGYLSYNPKCLCRKVSKSSYGMKCGRGAKSEIIGSLWTGNLYGRGLVQLMMRYSSHLNFFNTVLNEIDTVGYYLVPKLASKMKKPVPKYEKLISALKKRKIPVSRCHFNEKGLKIDAGIEEIKRTISKIG